VLTAGRHYSFDVLVDNLVTPVSGPTFLQNRSETFTGVYTTPEASTLLLLGAGLAVLKAMARRREAQS
jgi:PEP-CTERM motif-containing protein